MEAEEARMPKRRQRGITVPTMRAACQWAPDLLESFKAALGDAAEPAEVKVARRLIDTLEST